MVEPIQLIELPVPQPDIPLRKVDIAPGHLHPPMYENCLQADLVTAGAQLVGGESMPQRVQGDADSGDLHLFP